MNEREYRRGGDPEDIVSYVGAFGTVLAVVLIVFVVAGGVALGVYLS